MVAALIIILLYLIYRYIREEQKETAQTKLWARELKEKEGREKAIEVYEKFNSVKISTVSRRNLESKRRQVIIALLRKKLEKKK